MTEAEPVQSAAAPPRRARVWWSVAVISVVAVVLAVLTVTGVLGGGGTNEQTASARSGSRPPAVGTAVAQRASLTVTAEHRGETKATVAELSSRVTGRVTEIRVDLGDVFKKGDLLARIDATLAERQAAEARAEVSSGEAALQRATAELAAARVELERGQNLYSERLVSEQELDARRSAVQIAEAQVSAAKAQQKQAAARVALSYQNVTEARLVAPFDGAVAERHLDPGSLVQLGSPVLRLVKKEPLRVSFRVPERDLSHVKAGMPIEVTTQATGPRRFSGVVTRRSAEVGRLDRSVTVEGVLAEETPLLLPGMYAVVHLVLRTLEDVVVVPSAALVERSTPEGESTGVYVVEGTRAKWRDVRILGSAESTTAVEPLNEGAVVITLGPDNLRDGGEVRVAGDDKR